MKPFKKLADIKSFTIEKIVKAYFERWNDNEKKYEKAETWQEGFTPKWLIETPEFMLPLSKDQVSQALMASFKLDGTSNIIGKSYLVKTNGKSGKEIRYFLNEMRIQQDIPMFLPEEEKELEKMGEILAKDSEDVPTKEELAQIPF